MKMAAPILMAIALSAATANADSYAVKWTASGFRTHSCGSFDADITVEGSQITIHIKAQDTYTMRGTEAPDGSFNAVAGNGTVRASGKFTEEKVEMLLQAACGSCTGTGQRAS